MSLSQERLESQNQVPRKIDQLMKRWENRISRKNMRLADRFVNLEVHVLLHFAIEVSNRRELWVACFEVERSRVSGGADLGILNQPISDQHTVAGIGKKLPVFVNVVKLMDTPERVVSTLVRLERVNSFYCFGAHTLYFSSLFPFVSSGILCDRKVDSPAWFLAGTCPDELICKVVKGAPEVVNNIASSGEEIEVPDLVLTQLNMLVSGSVVPA